MPRTTDGPHPAALGGAPARRETSPRKGGREPSGECAGGGPAAGSGRAGVRGLAAPRRRRAAGRPRPADVRLRGKHRPGRRVAISVDDVLALLAGGGTTGAAVRRPRAAAAAGPGRRARRCRARCGRSGHPGRRPKPAGESGRPRRHGGRRRGRGRGHRARRDRRRSGRCWPASGCRSQRCSAVWWRRHWRTGWRGGAASTATAWCWSASASTPPPPRSPTGRSCSSGCRTPRGPRSGSPVASTAAGGSRSYRWRWSC